ncbi:MAG: OmpA family protein [Elusimicrobia bacterium]|nr:OmpA family protein [Elusimicrobiota bacterium]
MSESADETQLWMVPYADLMSMLVILFMALFGYAYATKTPEMERTLASMELSLDTKNQSQARARLQEAELALELRNELATLGLQDIGLLVSAKRVKLTFPAPVLFDEGSAALAPQAAPLLDSVARLLAAAPNPILVEGHTDNVPIAGGRYRTNWELSAARAFSVVEHLIRRGVDSRRFSARGYAEHRPAADNATAEGRRANRRIEISLLRRGEAEVEEKP